MLRWRVAGVIAAGLGLAIICALPPARAAEPDTDVDGPEAAEPDTDGSEETAGAQDETAEESRAARTEGIEAMQVLGSVSGEAWQEVPSSAIGFDALEIKQERIQDVRDLSQYTPNLEIKTAFAAVNPVLFIRGIGLDDFNANSAGAVAIYQDGINMNSPAGQLFQFFDVESVEVLRGPQSGGYRNASAGAILTRSQRPTPDFGTYANFTYGNYNLYEGEAGVNIPIGEHVATRFSGKITKRDGYVKNRCHGEEIKPTRRGKTDLPWCEALWYPTFFPNRDPPYLQPASGYQSLGYPAKWRERVNDAYNWAARAQLFVDVPLAGGSLELLGNVHGGQNLGLATQYQQRGFGRVGGPNAPKVPARVNGYIDLDDDPYAGDYNAGDHEYLDLLGANLRARWAISDTHLLTSLSGYEWHDRDTLEDTDGSPRSILHSQYTDEAWQFSQDLRLESAWTDLLETTVGVYYLMEDLESSNLFDSGSTLSQEYTQDTRSFAAFGDLSWDFLSWSVGSWSQGLTLEGSVRYAHEYKKFGNFSTFGNWNNGWAGNQAAEGEEDASFSGVSGSASLTYSISEGKSIYAKFTRGWKPGHFNGGAVFSKQLISPVDPETVEGFEVGAKTSWFDGRLGLDAAFFSYDFENMQVFMLVQQIEGGGGPAIAQLINAQGAEMMGVEAELFAAPLPGLDLRWNLGYLDSEYYEFSVELFRQPNCPIGAPPECRELIPQPIEYTGNRMIGSPAWSMSGSVQYAIPLSYLPGDLGVITPRFSFSWKDDTFFDPAEGAGTRQDLPLGTIAQEAYWLINAGLDWTSPNQMLSVSGWVRNILDKEYLLTAFDLTDTGFGYVLDVYGQPRTYGLTISAQFF